MPDVAALLADAAATRGSGLAVVEEGGRSVTWAELDDAASRIASGLGDLGLVAGQRVLISLTNRLEFVSTYLGVLRAQLVAVPVNPRADERELARMLEDSGARLVVAEESTTAGLLAAIATLAEPVPLVQVDGEPASGAVGFDVLAEALIRRVPALPDNEKLACLLYTSGTSGLPRAVMLTHRALLANLEQTAAVTPPMLHGNDVVLGVLPLFHVYGLNAVLGGVLKHGAKLVLAQRFDPQGTLDLIEDEAISVVPVAPPVFDHWRTIDHLKDRLGPVRLVLSGSATLPAEIVEEFAARTGIPVHQGYGLTEAAPVVTSTLSSVALRPGSLGSALPGVGIRLVDDHGHEPEGDDPGEIWICGPNMFSGYWPDGADGPDEDGWWPTGDLGYLDDTGDLYLVDRLSEKIVIDGFAVLPSEVEAVIRNVYGVTGAAVIGGPDGELVAFVRAPGLDRAATERAVREMCERRLARFKWPSRIEVVDQLPLTPTGKVQKGRLRGQERRRAMGLIDR